MNKWNNKFMELSKYVATWSKDKNTKTGAVIVDSDNRVLSMGYNGFPVGCDDNKDERYERPLKYEYTEHAERNAIYSAAKNGVALKDATIFVMWFPCTDCARAIIQSGIKRLVCYEPDFTTPKWGEKFVISLEMLKESGVEIIYMEK